MSRERPRSTPPRTLDGGNDWVNEAKQNSTRHRDLSSPPPHSPTAPGSSSTSYPASQGINPTSYPVASSSLQRHRSQTHMVKPGLGQRRLSSPNVHLNSVAKSPSHSAQVSPHHLMSYQSSYTSPERKGGNPGQSTIRRSNTESGRLDRASSSGSVHYQPNQGLKFKRHISYYNQPSPHHASGGGQEASNLTVAAPPSSTTGYPAGKPWETSSVHSSQSDNTQISELSEPTFKRPRPRNHPRPNSRESRPSSGQSGGSRPASLFVADRQSGSDAAPNATTHSERGDAWQLEEDSVFHSPSTTSHMDPALLPQPHYFPHPHNPHTLTHPHTTQGGINTTFPQHHISHKHQPRPEAPPTATPLSSSLQRRQSFDCGSVRTTSRSASPLSQSSFDDESDQKLAPLRRAASIQMASSRRIVSVVDQEVFPPGRLGRTASTDGGTSGSGKPMMRSASQKCRTLPQTPSQRPFEIPSKKQQKKDKAKEAKRNAQLSSSSSSPQERRKKEVKQRERLKSSPIQRLRNHYSDSKVTSSSTSSSSSSSQAKRKPVNSPTPRKRFSAGNLLDEEEVDGGGPGGQQGQRSKVKREVDLSKRMSSPDGQLTPALMSRFFPSGQENDSSEGVASDSDSGSPHSRRAAASRTKSSGTLMLQKIKKKLIKIKSGAGGGGNTGSGGSTGGDGSDREREKEGGGGGGDSKEMWAVKLYRKKKLRSTSVANLDSTNGPTRLTQSMEQLSSPEPPDVVVGGGTPNGTPKLPRAWSSKGSKLMRRGSEPDLDAALAGLVRSSSKKNLAMDPVEALFETIEQGNSETLQQLLEAKVVTDLCVANEDDFLAVDLAAMLGHTHITKLLLEQGGKDSTRYCRDPLTRFGRITALLMDAEREQSSLRCELVTQNAASSSNAVKDLERRLRKWEWKGHLYRKMKNTFEQADVPAAPPTVQLHVTSSRSLTVTFSEPEETNGATVTRYKIEWCRSKHFAPIVGDFVMTDLRTSEYTIPDLSQGEMYYVRVSAYNMRGFGLSQLATPTCATPSSWHDVTSSLPRYEGTTDTIHRIAGQLSITLAHSPASSPPPGSSGTPSLNRAKSVKKGFTKLFAPTVKFHKSLKAGVYVSSLVYSDDSKVLVTVDDHIPIVEVTDSHSSSIGSDFVWLAKLACSWEQVRNMCEISEQFTSSPAVQFRNKLLHAILELQEAVGVQDLGLLHPLPYKDAHGAIVFVIVQYVKEARSLQAGISLKWTALPRLWKKRTLGGGNAIESLPVPDQIVLDAQEVIAYHSNSTKPLTRGLYLGYLKARSSVASMKVICSREHPNVLPHIKIRDNPNISSVEWEWLKSLPSQAPSTTPHHPHHPHHPNSSTHSLQKMLLPKIETFLHNLGISKADTESHQLYCQEAIELNEDITLLLVLPPFDQVCTAPGSSDHFVSLADFVPLPINTFEIMQLYTYQRSFMTKFSMVSSRLDLEQLVSQQRLREAFSNADLSAAKHLHSELDSFQERTDSTWKQMRWIEEAVHNGRNQSSENSMLMSIKRMREGNERKANSAPFSTIIKPPVSELPPVSRFTPAATTAGPPVSAGYLRVFPAYNTGLVKGTTVKLYITIMTTTAEVIRLVVYQLEKARLDRGLPGPPLTTEDLDDFFLVAITHDSREVVLDGQFNPLPLHNQCRLLVKRRSEELSLEEQVTSV